MVSNVVTVENAAMERQEYMDTKPQDRYSGRLKSACCRRCGSADGMQSVHRKTLAELSADVIALTAPWYSETGNNEYLFHVCPECNRNGIIPDGFMSVTTSILIWCYCAPDSMLPDYEETNDE